MANPQFTQTRNLYNDIRNQLLNDPKMQMALAKYIQQLSHQLQTQINHDPQNMNEARAFLIMQQQLQKIAQNIQTTLKQNFPPKTLTDADLRTPLNMSQALNNPNSIASELMRDTNAAIIASLIMEAEVIEQAEEIEASEAEEMETSQATATSNMRRDNNESADDDVELMTLGETTSDAIKVLDHGTKQEMKDKVTNNVFEKTFGKKIEPHDLMHALEEKVEGPFSKSRVPTPESFASKVTDNEK